MTPRRNRGIFRPERSPVKELPTELDPLVTDSLVLKKQGPELGEAQHRRSNCPHRHKRSLPSRKHSWEADKEKPGLGWARSTD
jgi:hypothetical protein